MTKRPASEIGGSSGCEACARDIQNRLGGDDVRRITPSEGRLFGSRYRGQFTEWHHHEVVEYEGNVYDAFGPRSRPSRKTRPRRDT